jgi:hypothetical protein
MRSTAVCVLAFGGLIVFSSCDSKPRGPQEAVGEFQDSDKSKAVEQDSKTEIVRLTEFPGGLELEKKPRPQGYDQEVEISGARSGGVAPSQRLALKEFVANEKQILRAVREAIYRNYREKYLPHREELRAALTETARVNGIQSDLIEMGMKGFPEIKTGNELDSLVALLAIRVHRPVNGVAKIGILFECPWERDEGLGVRVAGSTVEAIGTGEVAFSE